MSTNENAPITNFPAWLDDQYHAMVQQYRAALQRKVTEFERLTTLFPIGAAHVQIGLECLQEVEIPRIGRYEGATEEDRAWFSQCRKPDWEAIRREYEREVEKKLVRSD